MKIKLGQLKKIIREVLETVQENSDKELGNDLLKLAELYPEAYEALPEPYKNDRALTFYVDVNGNLCADHDLGGTWVWNGTDNWEQLQV